jgi:hypothetical protein
MITVIRQETPHLSFTPGKAGQAGPLQWGNPSPSGGLQDFSLALSFAWTMLQSVSIWLVPKHP